MTSNIEDKIAKDRIKHLILKDNLPNCTNLCFIIVQIFNHILCRDIKKMKLVVPNIAIDGQRLIFRKRYIDHENLLLHIYYAFVFS